MLIRYIRHHRYVLQEDAIYTCEAYDERTANVPNGNNLKDRICKNECTRKEVEVYVAETLKETCQGVVGRIFLPPTKMVFYMHQYKHILDIIYHTIDISAISCFLSVISFRDKPFTRSATNTFIRVIVVLNVIKWSYIIMG